jgi:predicted Ser/Thr protein kinase
MTVQAEMIGKYVGDYQITKLLGEGGMGVVYKGVHPTLGQLVAIKMLHPNLVKAEAIKQRFLREAQAMARLRHPNILQLFNFVENPEGCFIVMEFVEGRTFESLLEEQGLIAPERAIELFLPVLSAMSYAHSQGIIHRDIKPSNIMLLNSGNVVKVMDFGTAKMAGGPQLTAAGMTLGTVVYMSPEQLMGRDLSPQADIYSLGVTLYEMTTGRLPFYHENEMQLMKMIMKEAPPPPSSIYPAMPKALEKVILKAIEKDLGKRYRTTDEFANDLKAVERELAGAIAPAVGAASVGAASGATPRPGAAVVPPAESAQPVLPPVEDTQAMARREPSAAAVAAPGGTPAKKPSTVLIVAGALTAVAGIGAGVPLLVIGHAVVGAVILGALFAVGATLLVLGLVGGGGGAAAPAREGAVPGEATLTPGPDKRTCPTCNRVLLPSMRSCPFCAPSPVKADEATSEAKPAPSPERIVTPPGFNVAGKAFIEIIDGPNRGQRLDLNEQPITIGRAPDNMVVIKDPAVSSHHARIDYYQGKYFFSDLQSSNGTYINNTRIEQTQIKHRDVIVMGGSRMLVNLM